MNLNELFKGQDAKDGPIDLLGRMFRSTWMRVAAATAATLTAPDIIPAGSIVWGVSVLVEVTFSDASGLTTFRIGDGTDDDRWGAAISRAKDTRTDMRNITITSVPVYAAATSVVLTATAGTFNAAAGRAKIWVYYGDPTRGIA